MVVDIHSLLEKNPVTKTMLKPKFGYKYLGPYNGPLEKQMLYDKKTGDIYKYHDKPKNVLDKIASRHDICYELKPKNKGLCDRIMVKEIDSVPFKERPWGTFAIKQIINTKQKLGLGVENSNKILSEELHKPKRKNFPRRKIIVNHIDEIFAADLVVMQKFAKLNKGYRYLLTCIDIFSKYSWVIPLKDKKELMLKMLYKKFLLKDHQNFYGLIVVKNFTINKCKIY